MLSPYESVLLERRNRALPNLELWERLIDISHVDSYDKMVIDLCGIGYEDWLTTNDTNPSFFASEKLTTATNINQLRPTSEDISDCRSDSEDISDSISNSEGISNCGSPCHV